MVRYDRNAGAQLGYVAPWPRAVLAEGHQRRLCDINAKAEGIEARLIKRAVGEQIELTLLDAVFHVAVSAVDLFIEPLPPLKLASRADLDANSFPPNSAKAKRPIK